LYLGRAVKEITTPDGSRECNLSLVNIERIARTFRISLSELFRGV
jgi:hypothetical protein